MATCEVQRPFAFLVRPDVIGLYRRSSNDATTTAQRVKLAGAKADATSSLRLTCSRVPFYGLSSFFVSTGGRVFGARLVLASGVPHSSKAATAFLASAIVSSHAAGSPLAIASHPPPLLTRANALRAFARAASGEPLSEISAATLNALPARVTTQLGQGDFARAPTATKINKRPAAGHRRSHNLGKRIMGSLRSVF